MYSCIIQIYKRLSVEYNSDEETTLSLSLLTDRTLLLRAHKDVSEVAFSTKCRGVLAKYNVTLKEYYCVCWANCRWRPPTPVEAEQIATFRKAIIRDTKIRQIVVGIVYAVILITGVTGRFNNSEQM